MTEPAAQVIPTSIESEMRASFIDYAMSVIISRALPNVRDGLKPVHRRILYAMYQLKNFHNQSYKKSARIVGDVIGRFHPHGDQAVYEALVRMAQDFSLRYPLADGQGNFGSIDGDPAAAMRYTEVRMSKIGEEMLADIEADTVGWQPNYDDKEQEPEILPAKIPNLLINGAQGIAVGMATSIPPHNIVEVINATVALVRNPKMTVPELMQIMPGPDFPTAGFILGRQGIQQAYETGRGHVIMRARTRVEDGAKGKKPAIIVTELPYQVNKAKLIEKIAALAKEKRIDGISDLRDESDREGIRVVIELRRDAVPEVVLNQLFKLTPLQETFGVNMLAIVDGRPEILPLTRVLWKFVEHRREVVTRRSAFELREAEAREHILLGLKICLDHLDEVIALIRKAESPAVAKEGLIKTFEMTEIQAQAILDMRLQRLTGLEREKILAELAELQAKIAYLRDLLSSREKLLELVIKELLEIRDLYADARRTEIVDATAEIAVADMIVAEEMVVTVTHSGYIKRNPISAYRAQKRGGKGVTGVSPRAEDFVRLIFAANTHDLVLMFTNTGRVYCKKVYEIPEGGRASRGKAIVNMLELRPEESVHELLAIQAFEEGKFVVMATRQGVIKKTALMEFANVRSSGIIAIDLEQGDELIGVRLTDASKHVFLNTQNGMSIRFPEAQVRSMGRAARGVRGVSLREEDKVVGMEVLEPESAAAVVTVCQLGYGKRTAAGEFRVQNRGGHGIISIKTTERNGKVVASRVVEETDELMLITDVGKVIRMPVKDISRVGRNTQGVRLIRREENERVVALERLAESDEENDERVGADSADSVISASEQEEELKQAGAEPEEPLPDEPDGEGEGEPEPNE
jgi:DNA gyrase subunit A